jgi:hypothetical protein
MITYDLAGKAALVTVVRDACLRQAPHHEDGVSWHILKKTTNTALILRSAHLGASRRMAAGAFAFVAVLRDGRFAASSGRGQWVY